MHVIGASIGETLRGDIMTKQMCSEQEAHMEELMSGMYVCLFPIHDHKRWKMVLTCREKHIRELTDIPAVGAPVISRAKEEAQEAFESLQRAIVDLTQDTNTWSPFVLTAINPNHNPYGRPYSKGKYPLRRVRRFFPYFWVCCDLHIVVYF